MGCSCSSWGASAVANCSRWYQIHYGGHSDRTVTNREPQQANGTTSSLAHRPGTNPSSCGGWRAATDLFLFLLSGSWIQYYFSLFLRHPPSLFSCFEYQIWFQASCRESPLWPPPSSVSTGMPCFLSTSNTYYVKLETKPIGRCSQRQRDCLYHSQLSLV